MQGFAEQSLGDILGTGITAGDFSDHRNAQLFNAIVETDKAGEVKGNHVIGRSVRVRMGGYGSHYDWVKENGSLAQNAFAYADSVLKFSRLREIQSRIRLLNNVIESTKLNDGLTVHAKIVAEIASLLTEQRSTKGAKLVADILNDELFPELERRQTEYEQSRTLPGCTTGISTLDKFLVGGFKPGAMYTVASRTGVGKTTLGVNFAYQAARTGKHAVFFTVEMERREIAAKFLSLVSGIRSDVIEVGSIKNLDKQLEATKIGLTALPLYVDDTFCGSMDDVAATCRSLKRRGMIDLAVLDYLQLLSVGTKWKSEYERVTEVSTFIKRLALELRIPIVCLAQLNRAAAAEVEPDMHHLKGSGQIEQDSNAVMVVFREGADGPLWMKLTKNRAGRTSDRIPLSIDYSISKVNDMALHYADREPI